MFDGWNNEEEDEVGALSVEALKGKFNLEVWFYYLRLNFAGVENKFGVSLASSFAGVENKFGVSLASSFAGFENKLGFTFKDIFY